MLGACCSLLVALVALLTLGEATPAAPSTGDDWSQAASEASANAMHKNTATDECLGDEMCQQQQQQNYMELCNLNPQICDDVIEEMKRAQGFSSWGGKRVPFQSWGGKRVPFQSWGGKRVPFQSWGGKRVPFSTWGGKRAGDDENKRSTFNSWGGKRSIEDGKRGTFNSWGGKRGGFSSWGGKRAATDAVFYNWGGKRASEEELRDKRAISGKRTSNPRPKINRLLAGSETVAIRRGTVDFFPWGGKRTQPL